MTTDELYDFAERNNIDVDSFALRNNEALSLYDADTQLCSIAIDPDKIQSPADEKVKLAHELGHCARYAFYDITTPNDIIRRQEFRADRWAIARLIPKDEMNDAIRGGCRNIYELAEYFGVTEDFARKAVFWNTHPIIA